MNPLNLFKRIQDKEAIFEFNFGINGAKAATNLTVIIVEVFLNIIICINFYNILLEEHKKCYRRVSSQTKHTFYVLSPDKL